MWERRQPPPLKFGLIPDYFGLFWNIWEQHRLTHNYIQKTLSKSWAGQLGMAGQGSWRMAGQGGWALENIANTEPESLERSEWLLEPAQNHKSAQMVCVSPCLGHRAGAQAVTLSALGCRAGAQAATSSALGHRAGARAAPLGALGHSAEAVSYTHRTLPTIPLV